MLAVSLGGRVLLSADRAATGFGFGGRRASLLLSFAEGAGALPPPPRPPSVKLFPGEGGGVSAAQAQRLQRPKAVQLRRFCTREVHLGAVVCLANSRRVPLPRYAGGLLSNPGASLPRLKPGRGPGSWNLALSNAEEGDVESERETCNFRSATRI